MTSTDSATAVTSSGIVSEQDLETLTGLFRLLSDRTRLNILLLLSAGERNVTHLCTQLKLPQPTVSHHLGLLRMSQVIDNRRSGKQVFYTLNPRVAINDNDTEALEIVAGPYAVRIIPKHKPHV